MSSGGEEVSPDTSAVLPGVLWGGIHLVLGSPLGTLALQYSKWGWQCFSLLLQQRAADALPVWAPKVRWHPQRQRASPQVSLLLLPALQLSARLCSVMEGGFLQVNFWLTVFASCHQHTTSCQHISRGSSRQCIQCSPRWGLVPFLLSPSVTSAGLLGWQVQQEVAEGRV